MSSIVCRLVTKLHETTDTSKRKEIVEGLADDLMTSDIIDMTQFVTLCTKPESNDAVMDLLETIENQIVRNPKILPEILLQMDKQCLCDLIQELREDLEKGYLAGVKNNE